MSTTSETFCALLDAHDDAVHRFNSLPDDADDTPEYEQASQAMCHASDQADKAVPTSWLEFARLLSHMASGGQTGIDEDNANRLMLHARRLLSGGLQIEARTPIRDLMIMLERAIDRGAATDQAPDNANDSMPSRSWSRQHSALTFAIIHEPPRDAFDVLAILMRLAGHHDVISSAEDDAMPRERRDLNEMIAIALPNCITKLAELLPASGWRTKEVEDELRYYAGQVRRWLPKVEPEMQDERRTAWDAALAEYHRLKAIFDDMPSCTDGGDEANEASLDALDKLIVDTPAPDFDALLLKMDMAQERCEGFSFSEEYAAAIRADVERLKQGVR
ncbi:hypothetical protein ACWGNZ_07935 [Sphingomonas zeae]|jgi:hypothetical protein